MVIILIPSGMHTEVVIMTCSDAVMNCHRDAWTEHMLFLDVFLVSPLVEWLSLPWTNLVISSFSW